MPNEKLTNLPSVGADSTADDLMYIVDDPGSTPASKKVTLEQLFGNVKTPVKVTTTNSAALLVENAGGTDVVNVDTSTPQVTFGADILPAADSAYDLGSNSVRYSAAYADMVSGVNLTSADVVNAVYHGMSTSNSAADNATALLAAINAVAASTRAGVVFIPDGVYQLNPVEIPANCPGLTIRGATSQGAGLAPVSDKGTVLVQNSTTTGLFTAAANSPRHLRFVDLTFKHAADGCSHIFDFAAGGTPYGIEYLLFDHCYAPLGSKTGSFLKGSNGYIAYIKIRDCILAAYGGHTVPIIDLETLASGGMNHFGIEIVDCRIIGQANGAAPMVEITGNNTTGISYGPYIRNCVFSTGRAGHLHCHSTVHTIIQGCFIADLGALPEAHTILFDDTGAAGEPCGDITIIGTLSAGCNPSPERPWYDLSVTAGRGGVTLIGCDIRKLDVPEGLVMVGCSEYPNITVYSTGTTATKITDDVWVNGGNVYALASNAGYTFDWSARSTGTMGAANTTMYLSLGAGAFSGTITVAVNDTYSANNANGVLERTYAVARTAGLAIVEGAWTAKTTRTEGGASYLFNLGEMLFDSDGSVTGTAGAIYIPIKRVSGSSRLTVRVTGQLTAQGNCQTIMQTAALVEPSPPLAEAAESVQQGDNPRYLMRWAGRTAAAVDATNNRVWLNLGTGAMSGNISVSVTDGYVSGSYDGKLTRTFGIVRAANSAPTAPTPRSNITCDAVGVGQGLNIGQIETNGASLRIPIDRLEGSNRITVEVEACFTEPGNAESLQRDISLDEPTTGATATTAQFATFPTNIGLGTKSGTTVGVVYGNEGSGGDLRLSSTTNATKGSVYVDGMLELDTAVYEDMRVVPGAWQFAGSGDPEIASWQPGGSGATFKVYEFAPSDQAFFTVQLPHSYQEGQDIRAHVHWTPGPHATVQSGNSVAWKIDYSWGNIEGVFGASSTVDLTDQCQAVNHEHLMTDPQTISGATRLISSMLVCRIYRDTGDTWSVNTPGNNPILLEIDFHFPVNTLGSSAPGTK